MQAVCQHPPRPIRPTSSATCARQPKQARRTAIGTDGGEDLKRYNDHSNFTTARARQVYAENYRDGYDAGYNVGINQQEASPASAHE